MSFIIILRTAANESNSSRIKTRNDRSHEIYHVEPSKRVTSKSMSRLQEDEAEIYLDIYVYHDFQIEKYSENTPQSTPRFNYASGQFLARESCERAGDGVHLSCDDLSDWSLQHVRH